MPGGLGGKRRALKGAGRGMANVTGAEEWRDWEDSEERMPGRSWGHGRILRLRSGAGERRERPRRSGWVEHSMGSFFPQSLSIPHVSNINSSGFRHESVRPGDGWQLTGVGGTCGKTVRPLAQRPLRRGEGGRLEPIEDDGERSPTRPQRGACLEGEGQEARDERGGGVGFGGTSVWPGGVSTDPSPSSLNIILCP